MKLKIRQNKLIVFCILLVISVVTISTVSMTRKVFAASNEIYATLQDPTILKASLVEGEPSFSCTKDTTYTYPYPVNKEQVNTYHCKNARLKYIPVSEEGVTPKRTQVAGWLENKMSITDNKQYNYRAACSFPYWYNGQRINRISGSDSVVACNVTSSYDWNSAAYDFATPVTQEMLVEAAKNKQSEVTIATWGFSWETPAWEGGSQRIIIMLDLNSTYLYGLDGDTSKPLFDPEIAEDLATDKKPEPDSPSGGGDSGQGSESENEKNPEPDEGQDTETSNNQNDDANNNSNVLDKTDESSDINKTPKAPNTGSNYDLDRTDVAAKDFILLSGIAFLVLLGLASIYKVSKK